MKINAIITRTKNGKVEVVESANRITVYGPYEQIGTPEKIEAAIAAARGKKR